VGSRTTGGAGGEGRRGVGGGGGDKGGGGGGGGGESLQQVTLTGNWLVSHYTGNAEGYESRRRPQSFLAVFTTV